MPAPDWARALAEEAIRERDCEPSALYPPTPREEDASLDDLPYWLRAAERFIEAVTNGWVHKRDWTYWCRIFERTPCVNAHFAALLPRVLEARRLRRDNARIEATQRSKLELAKAVPAVPPDARANGCFLAPSGGGKTTTLVSLLIGPYARVFDAVHVFSPSVDIDSAWDPMRDFAKGLKESSFHPEWDEPALLDKLAKQKQLVKEKKSAKSTKPLPQALIVVDDYADRWDIIRNAQNVLTTVGGTLAAAAGSRARSSQRSARSRA
jgi:hypothetical protein